MWLQPENHASQIHLLLVLELSTKIHGPSKGGYFGLLKFNKILIRPWRLFPWEFLFHDTKAVPLQLWCWKICMINALTWKTRKKYPQAKISILTLFIFAGIHVTLPDVTGQPWWHRGSGQDCRSDNPSLIPGLPSPHVGPLMARRLKTSLDVPVPVSW